MAAISNSGTKNEEVKVSEEVSEMEGSFFMPAFNENIEADMAHLKMRLEKSLCKEIAKSSKAIRRSIRNWEKVNRLHLPQSL